MFDNSKIGLQRESIFSGDMQLFLHAMTIDLGKGALKVFRVLNLGEKIIKAEL